MLYEKFDVEYDYSIFDVKFHWNIWCRISLKFSSLNHIETFADKYHCNIWCKTTLIIVYFFNFIKEFKNEMKLKFVMLKLYKKKCFVKNIWAIHIKLINS